jgi:hypothetical protein
MCSVTVTGKMERYAEQLESSQERYGLVVDGASLHLIMPVEENKQLLFQVQQGLAAPLPGTAQSSSSSSRYSTV